MTELKACPLCGSNNISIDNDGDDWWMIQCNACELKYESSPGDLSQESKEAAIEEWNTRPIEDALRNRIEELEGFVRRVSQQKDLVRWFRSDGAYFPSNLPEEAQRLLDKKGE